MKYIHEDYVTNICFMENNQYMVSGGDDSMLYLWDIG